LEIATAKSVDESYHQVESTGYVAAVAWKGSLRPEPVGLRLEDASADRQVLVLLGEPGIGKSSEWRKLRDQLAGEDQHLFLNLGDFAADSELREALEKDPKVEHWQRQATATELTLWLDSLDEGLLHMRKLQGTLQRILSRLPLERLRLRLTCRNAVWPVAFTEALSDLWNFGPKPTSQQISVLLLRPLTQEQVAQAAETEGLVAEDFLQAVAELDAQPLASIPVTLRLLLTLYKKHQPGFGISESAGRAGLYERGCLELCTVPDEERGDPFRPDGRQRLLLAGYLAYLAVLSNRRQIHIEPVKGELGENALDPYAAGAGQTAMWQGQRATISLATIGDLLKNTSLFTDLGNGCLVWVHQAFAEFLAAWYLNLTSIRPASLRALFRSAADPAGGVVPALRETAAWLSELRPAFWQELLHLDPLALVRGDLRRLRDGQRAEVVQRLADVIGTLAYAPYLENRAQNFMQQLRHPGLAAQLEPLLTLDEVPPATARFARDVAEGCDVQELVPVLTTQALDPAQPFYKRERALSILRTIMPEAAKSVLRPLIHCIPAEDERDEFRGNLLHILWPDHLAPDELLPLLTPEKDDHYLGGYRSFMYQLERQDIAFSAQAVKAGLDWLSRNWASLEYRYRRTEFWPRISSLIWQQAWQLVAEPGVVVAIAAAYAALAEHHDHFSVKGASDAARIAVMRELAAVHYKTVRWTTVIFAYSQQDALVGEADWDILFPLVYERHSAGQRGWVALVLRRMLADARAVAPTAVYCQRYEEFLEAARKYASVRAVWWEWFKPVKLTSKEAKEDRKQWQQNQKRTRKERWQKRNRRRQALRKIGEQARLVRWLVERTVDQACQGWCYLLNSFRLNKTAKSHYRQNDDPSQSKRWTRLAPRLQAKILDRLWEFVEQYPVPPTTWYGPGNRTTYGADALREGMVLLLSQREHLIRSQPPQFWQDRAIFLVWFDDHTYEVLWKELLHLAAQHAPVEVASAIVLSMDERDNREHGELNYFKNFYHWLPTTRFAALLLAGIEFGVWKEALSAQVLIAMLEVDYAPAWEYVRELLSVPAGQVLERPKLAIALFRSLLFRKTAPLPDAWHYWEWLSNHLEIARAVISTEIRHSAPSEFAYLGRLLEDELATLAVWLTWGFDLLATDENDWNGNPRGSFAGLRTAAAAELAGRGTTTAWRLLEDLNEQFGRPYWLKVRLDQVRENLRRNAWVPTGPEELIVLSQQADKWLITSATDLQELVLDALRRMQADLHNELAAADLLWTPIKRGNKVVSHKVRDENFLSDVLRLYLAKDLRRPEVLIKREVEIRKSIGKGTGQRTDLFIDAFTRDAQGEKTEVVTVVIEVKLAKNKETETALAGQLIPYLADQSYKHGIYLIGWHYGERDPRPTGKKDLVALHRLLQQQMTLVPAAYAIRTLIMDIRLPADSARGMDAASLFEAI